MQNIIDCACAGFAVLLTSLSNMCNTLRNNSHWFKLFIVALSQENFSTILGSRTVYCTF